MAEVLTADEELIAQAQERERARLEEEAAILAAQQAQSPPPPVWAGSPVEAIDQFNAQPGIISAPTTIDSAQYANELARAQRGSGFIAPNVAPTGEVITHGYDPSTDLRALKATQEAANLQRNQYMSSLMSGGATAAEAYRAALGRYPNVANPETLLKAEALALRQSFTPRRVTSGGVAYDELRPGAFSRAPIPAPQKMVPGKPTPALRAREDILKEQISGLRRQLNPSGSELPLSPERIAQIESLIAGKEQERIALFGNPESNPNVDQVGWENMRARFNAPSQAPIPQAAMATPPTSAEKVVVVKDGKRFYLPKSQLDEALKAGYKQGQ